MTDSGERSAVERLVDVAAAGERLDVFLARQPEIGSRTKAKALIVAGEVRVDGALGRPSQAVEPGQTVSFVLAPDTAGETASVAAPRIAVLFEDSHLLVIAKPAGLPTHPPFGQRLTDASVAGQALSLCGSLPTLAGADRPGIVHRLDKDTTGVMVLARTDEAFHFLQSQFKGRTVDKEYRALCFGEARFDSDHIERNIASQPGAGERMVVVPEGGREARTYYEVVERFAGYTHFRCLPKTGRTHQIRVHMASIGHSLVGDALYRSRRAQHAQLPAGAPDPGRHCLHALRLGFLHPRTHEPLTFTAPLADDIERLLAWLREHSART